MKPARNSKRFGEGTRLLVVQDDKAPGHRRVVDLGEQLKAGDLLVVNTSSTLPSSFEAQLQRSSEKLEVRLASFAGDSPFDLSEWWAVAFGSGTWRDPTEKRGKAPSLMVGDTLQLSSKLSARVLEVKEERLFRLRFESSGSLVSELYNAGRPIQYSYLEEELAVWDQQTLFSGPPLSVEAPSTAFPLTWDLLLKLRERGVKLATLWHGAGISSSGEDRIDALFPLEEWYHIPDATVAAVEEARRYRARVVAVGTTVVRALESASLAAKSNSGELLKAGDGKTKLRITPDFVPQVVDLLLTGMHEDGSSHMDILDAFCRKDRVRDAYNEARALDYRGHEYGDLSLMNCSLCRKSS